MPRGVHTAERPGGSEPCPGPATPQKGRHPQPRPACARAILGVSSSVEYPPTSITPAVPFVSTCFHFPSDSRPAGSSVLARWRISPHRPAGSHLRSLPGSSPRFRVAPSAWCLTRLLRRSLPTQFERWPKPPVSLWLGSEEPHRVVLYLFQQRPVAIASVSPGSSLGPRALRISQNPEGPACDSPLA